MSKVLSLASTTKAKARLIRLTKSLAAAEIEELLNDPDFVRGVEVPKDEILPQAKIQRFIESLSNPEARRLLDDWDATLEIYNNPELMKRIEEGEKEIERGEFIVLDEAARKRLFG